MAPAAATSCQRVHQDYVDEPNCCAAAYGARRCHRLARSSRFRAAIEERALDNTEAAASNWGVTVEEKARRFARRMLEPILAEFRREVAQLGANGANEADIEAMLARVENTNRPVMDPDQFEYFMELFRDAASPGAHRN